jgi:hypothetical protein
MSWTRPRNAVVLGIAAALLLAAQAETEVLLRDDFNAPPLDTSKWSVPTGPGTFLGRTQIRPPSSTLSITGGSIRLQLDTYNPWSRVPGDSFLGSEIGTVDTYEIEDGLIVEARVRLVSPLPGGLVGSLFSYGLSGDVRDEIDFELLSNDLVAAEERVLTNVFDSHNFIFPGVHAHAGVAGLDLDGFHVYRIEWFPDRVIWYVDNVFVREETGTVPDDPQNIRLNFWAPDTFFKAAYDARLVPAAAPEDNEIYFYEVDWVKIRRPLPLSARLRPWAGPALGVLAVLAVAVAIVRRSRA